MPQGSKAKYTDKQKRKAEHIEEGYEKKGLSEKESEKRAWATVNKQDGGGKKKRGSASSAIKSAKVHHGAHPPKKHQKTRKKTGKNKDK